MIEFLGGPSLPEVTAVYILGNRPSFYADKIHRRSPSDLPECLDQGLEICRSFWDNASLIVDLDIDYINLDFTAEPYLDPLRTFEVQQPVENAIRSILGEYGIHALQIVSGRGYHFIWRVRRDSEAFQIFCDLSNVSEDFSDSFLQSLSPFGDAIDKSMTAAFVGLGMVLEHLAHRIKEKATHDSIIPVEITSVAVGSRSRGRELISIDLSEYGDPLVSRFLRVPFSRYLKPQQEAGTLGEGIVKGLPQMIVIPSYGLSLKEAIHIMRSPSEAAEAAEGSCTEIPDASDTTLRLIADYTKSPLAEFHDFFYSWEPHTTTYWDQKYKSIDIDILPPCAHSILESRPSEDLLLKPSGLARVVRTLLALDYHPREVAGIIWSRFNCNYPWKDDYPWNIPQPRTRAEFYVRLFAGLVFSKVDELIDFNCVSAKEKSFCFHETCGYNLTDYRTRLLRRIPHE